MWGKTPLHKSQTTQSTPLHNPANKNSAFYNPEKQAIIIASTSSFLPYTKALWSTRMWLSEFPYFARTYQREKRAGIEFFPIWNRNREKASFQREKLLCQSEESVFARHHSAVIWKDSDWVGDLWSFTSFHVKNKLLNNGQGSRVGLVNLKLCFPLLPSCVTVCKTMHLVSGSRIRVTSI